ncbi:aminotransferase class V-fold PLP-dependent enzyme [Gemella sp. zg-570]|uniref:aminotransferase class V-fold PLP-dependent enzyme n=1 Tax=Gemella sp. zg-570 TaxID=2840371 RepID=UPI001C0BC561|nr:aminotransferase class V-fold PLP-dependent enzyme [Gemella sp. zg-570]QWQ39393.1 aminotransferase class V-fold PLP-dependent enzyme [Gemella sp. zg-570]
MIYKIANTKEEYEQIFKLNYETFVNEIPQHEKNEDEILIDKFHDNNIYIIAKKGSEVIGMISLCDKRPFSLDQKVNGIEKHYKGDFNKPIEIRLLSIKNEYRKTKVFFSLVERVFSYTIQNSYDIIFISGTIRQEKLYNHIGFKRFYDNVGTKDAEYIPMFLNLKESDSKVLKKLSNYKTINYLPGPVDLSNEVLEKLHKKLYSHRSKEFVNLAENTVEKLKRILSVKNVTILHGSGTLANESIFAQLTERKLGKGIILANGEFGKRLINQAKRHDLYFETYSVDFGESFDLDYLLNEIKNNNYKYIYLVHHETSVGILNNLHEITDIARENNLVIAVDAISAAGAIKYDYSNVDYVACSSGKALCSVAGLAIVGHNTELLDLSSESLYLDLSYANKNLSIPFTQPSLLMESLNMALDNFKNDNVYFDILKRYKYMKDKLEKINLSIMKVKESEQSPIIITVIIPNNISSKNIGDSLAINNIFIHYNSKYLVEKNLLQFSFINKYTNFEEIDYTVDILNEMIGE